LLAAGPLLRADVKMPAIFGDNMVLQQEMKAPLWGTADAGEKITVNGGGQSAETTAGLDGKWRVDLGPYPNGTGAFTLTVAGKNTLTFQNVLPGDVWIFSGQSNMEYALGSAATGAQAAAQATDPDIRIFVVKRAISPTPLSDLQGKWEVCRPGVVGTFSAVGYFFAHKLRQTVKHPMGLIGTYWGGTPGEAWLPLPAIQNDPSLKMWLDAYTKFQADYPAAKAAFPAQTADYQAKLAQWQTDAGNAFDQAMAGWKTAAAAAKAAGQSEPPKPQPAKPKPNPPMSPDDNNHMVTGLFNAMVAPLVPYGIKGVVWYQGEANAFHQLAYPYRALLANGLIKGWRDQWGEGDFTFLVVQLPGLDSKGMWDRWAELRESQDHAVASQPNAGLAVTIDLGDPNNIHPAGKEPVGDRLALLARHLTFGEKDLVWMGPTFSGIKIDGPTATITFANTGSGLVIGSAPWVPADRKPLPTTSLLGFALAGADQKFVPAEARIDGNTVIVSSPDVPNPVAVQYAWGQFPDCNLYNKEGLPAAPFRTDNWED
jgi:sialate O-acetylesterase